MRKLLTLNIACIAVLTGCNAGSGSSSSSSTCPANAPLFTVAIGNQILESWGMNAQYYSPYESAATCISAGVPYNCQDPYVGAAFFTGIEYLYDVAVLMPTVSPDTRVGSQEIYNYFTTFLATGPVMTNNPGVPESGGPYDTLAGCGYGVMSGYYNFAFQNGSESANARYTFQFQYNAESQLAQITIESGTDSGVQILVNQGPGWYIYLQNSAVLPPE